ncbi:MAG: hypothetical protein AABZ08_10915 [Planctomycetota bacterium]
MAGHAPEIHSQVRRVEQWLIDTSDLRVSLVMLLTAAAVITALYLLDQGLAA